VGTQYGQIMDQAIEKNGRHRALRPPHFVDQISEDRESRELIRLRVEDESSSGNSLRLECTALNPPAQEPQPRR
jgi:hypothetical protein